MAIKTVSISNTKKNGRNFVIHALLLANSNLKNVAFFPIILYKHKRALYRFSLLGTKLSFYSFFESRSAHSKVLFIY